MLISWSPHTHPISSMLQDTRITLDGETCKDIGITVWRSQVLYVPQSRVPLTDTPEAFLTTLQSLHVNKHRTFCELAHIFAQLDLEPALVNAPWSSLSAGQAQRAYLACCVATCPRVLLLDHPTSACCPVTASLYVCLATS